MTSKTTVAVSSFDKMHDPFRDIGRPPSIGLCLAVQDGAGNSSLPGEKFTLSVPTCQCECWKPPASERAPLTKISSPSLKTPTGHPHPAQSVIDLLTHAFRQQARNGDLRAAGIGYDARTTPQSAVHVEDPAYQVAKIRLREARFHAPAPSPYPFGVLSI